MKKTLEKLEHDCLEELEHAYFMLQMCDHWDSSDYKYAAELREKIKELKGENK